jgi:hypothetical protein
MMFWAHGYGGGIEQEFTPGVVSNILDWAGQNQDLDFLEEGREALTGVLTVDGHPTWSFGDGATSRYARRAATMLKPDTTALVPADVRTVWSVILPVTFTDPGVGFPITGGPLFAFQESPCFESLFDLEAFFNPAGGFYLFDNAWRFGDELAGPDTPAGTYAGIPTIVCCIGAPGTGAPITIYVNGVLVGTTPAVAGGTAAAGNTGFVSGNCPSISGALNNVPFQGGIAEQIAYLGDQATDAPADFAATLAYLRAIYPSVP